MPSPTTVQARTGPATDASAPVPDTPYSPYALSRHDALWGAIVIILSAGMFAVTPVLAVLRKTGVVGIDWVWVFLPATLCVAAVFLHGVAELIRTLVHDRT